MDDLRAWLASGTRSLTDANVITMADRTHLTPVVITDRTGRTTTVYRRPSTPGRTVPSVPVPKPNGPGSRALPAAQRTTRDMKAFLRGFTHPQFHEIHQGTRAALSTDDGSTAVARAMDLIDGGDIEAETAVRIISYRGAIERDPPSS